MTLDDAIVDAISLKKRADAGDVDAIFAEMDARIADISNELDLATLLPGGPSAELGMAARRRNSKEFFTIFKRRIRANLCDRNGEFYKLIQAGIQGSAGAIVTALATALALPAVALPVLVPLGALICHSGLETFCEMED